jgi:hypothetical protein
MPDVHGGAFDRPARPDVHEREHEPQRYAGLALANVCADLDIVEVVRPLDLLGRQNAGQARGWSHDGPGGTAPRERRDPDERVSTSDHTGGAAHSHISSRMGV